MPCPGPGPPFSVSTTVLHNILCLMTDPVAWIFKIASTYCAGEDLAIEGSMVGAGLCWSLSDLVYKSPVTLQSRV